MKVNLDFGWIEKKMFFMKSFLGILFSVVMIFASTRMASAEGTVVTWDVDGVTREALIFTPASAKDEKKHPLIFAFHGHGGSMNGARAWGYERLWPEALVVRLVVPL